MAAGQRWAAVAVGVSVSVAMLSGCGIEKSRNPLSPSIAGPIEGVVISAPIPVPLTNGQLIRATEQPITLGFSAAMSNSERPFWYEIEVSTSDLFDALIHTADQVSPSGGEAESYKLPELAADQRYVWRVRAFDGVNTGPYSEVAAFEVYTPVTVGRPQPDSPVSDAQVDDTSTTLTVRNAEVAGPAQNVRYEFQWATDAGLSQGLQSVTVPAGDSTTSATIRELDDETRYYWRSRALADSREPEPIVGEWSETESFMMPPPASDPIPPGPTPPSSADPCRGGDPPNMLAVVRQLAAAHPQSLANSCQDQGGSWDFMDRVVETFRQYSQCWGYNCKRGDCNNISHDVVDYYRGTGDGNGSTNVAIFDVIVNHCTADPQPGWIDITQETANQGTVGRWKNPR